MLQVSASASAFSLVRIAARNAVRQLPNVINNPSSPVKRVPFKTFNEMAERNRKAVINKANEIGRARFEKNGGINPVDYFK